jgi:hypothetical protein
MPWGVSTVFIYTNDSSGVTAGWWGTVMKVQLKGSLEVVDTTLGPGSKAILVNLCPGRPLGGMPISIHTKDGPCPRLAILCPR